MLYDFPLCFCITWCSQGRNKPCVHLNCSNRGFCDFDSLVVSVWDCILIPEAVINSILGALALEFATCFCSGLFFFFFIPIYKKCFPLLSFEGALGKPPNFSVPVVQNNCSLKEKESVGGGMFCGVCSWWGAPCGWANPSDWPCSTPESAEFAALALLLPLPLQFLQPGYL